MVYFEKVMSFEECPICFDSMAGDEEVVAHVISRQDPNDIEVGKVHHAFHAACIGEWLIHDKSCPTCREPIQSVFQKSDWLNNSLIRVVCLTCLGTILVFVVLRRNML